MEFICCIWPVYIVFTSVSTFLAYKAYFWDLIKFYNSGSQLFSGHRPLKPDIIHQSPLPLAFRLKIFTYSSTVHNLDLPCGHPHDPVESPWVLRHQVEKPMFCNGVALNAMVQSVLPFCLVVMVVVVSDIWVSSYSSLHTVSFPWEQLC